MRGSTLLEVAASVAMLAALVLVLFDLLPGSLRAIGVSRQNLQATALAQSILDDYRSRPFASLHPGPVALAPVGEFKPALEVRAVEGAPESRFLELHLAIDWPGHHREFGVYVSKVRY